MSLGIVDTATLVHLYRNDPDALAWVGGLELSLSITAISWLELMVGASGKIGQARCKAIFSQFELVI